MKKRTMLVMFAALFILTAALLIGLFLPDSNGEDEGGIALPEQGDEVIDPIPGIAKENNGKVTKVTIDKGNVQRVIASLSRPEEYGCKTDATYYYDNGSATLESRWWVRPGVCRAMQYDAKGRLRTQVILTKNHVYLWGSEGVSYYEGNPGDFTSDELGRAPSYEDVCALPAKEILDGKLAEREGVSCIYVRSGTENSYTDWYISLNNGLLLYAETTEQGVLTYSAVLTALTVGPSDDALFLLPNGVKPE